MLEIWKYELLPITGAPFLMNIPDGAEILHVDEQREEVCIWALVDIDATPVSRSFAIFGTGQSVADNPMKYLGTAKLDNGNLIFHVFELI